MADISQAIKNRLRTYSQKCLDANGDFRAHFSCSACAAECKNLKAALDSDDWLNIAGALKTGSMTWAELTIKKGAGRLRDALGLNQPRGKIK